MEFLINYIQTLFREEKITITWIFSSKTLCYIAMLKKIMILQNTTIFFFYTDYYNYEHIQKINKLSKYLLRRSLIMKNVHKQ